MLLFVYGTLLRHGRNHPRLYEQGAIYIGDFQTVDRFDMHLRQRDIVPLAVRNPENGHPVAGELYAIDEGAIDHIDLCEGHPNVYERQTVTLHNFNETNGLVVHMYVYVGLVTDKAVVVPYQGALYFLAAKYGCDHEYRNS
jgi:gamma-glutamylcyclotransferase (GGCT)/AIG2-like uncharacterized protein YtfP